MGFKRAENWSLQEVNQMYDLYQHGLSQLDLSQELGASYKTIRKLFLIHNLKLMERPTLPSVCTKEIAFTMYENYKRGQTQKQIADKFGFNNLQVGRAFRRYGLKSRPRREAQIPTGIQKGYIGSGGYKGRMINGKRHKDHNLIWSSHNAGVQIPEGMVVHHINGKTLDNRIENLILMPISYHHKLHMTITQSKGRMRLPA